MAVIGITATPVSETGSITLSITGAPNAPLTITRTDGNGTGVVRQLAGQVPSGGTLVVSDFENALAGTVSYTVAPTTVDASYDPGTTSVNVSSYFTRNWLGVPVFPSLNVEVSDVTGLTQARQSKTTYHQIIGRQDDVANIQPLGLRSGAMTLRLNGFVAAGQVASVLERTEYMFMRLWGAQGLDAYFLVESVDITPIDEDYAGQRRVELVVNYREQKAPTAPRQGTLGWDVADLAGYSVAGAKAYFKTVANATAGTKG